MPGRNLLDASTSYAESLWCAAVKHNCSFHILVKGFDDAEKGWRASYSLEHFEETLSTDKVKCLCEVYEGHVERLLLFPALLL